MGARGQCKRLGDNPTQHGNRSNDASLWALKGYNDEPFSSRCFGLKRLRSVVIFFRVLWASKAALKGHFLPGALGLKGYIEGSFSQGALGLKGCIEGSFCSGCSGLKRLHCRSVFFKVLWA